jgi:hypothetical protein
VDLADYEVAYRGDVLCLFVWLEQGSCCEGTKEDIPVWSCTLCTLCSSWGLSPARRRRWTGASRWEHGAGRVLDGAVASYLMSVLETGLSYRPAGL